MADWSIFGRWSFAISVPQSPLHPPTINTSINCYRCLCRVCFRGPVNTSDWADVSKKPVSSPDQDLTVAWHDAASFTVSSLISCVKGTFIGLAALFSKEAFTLKTALRNKKKRQLVAGLRLNLVHPCLMCSFIYRGTNLLTSQLRDICETVFIS